MKEQNELSKENPSTNEDQVSLLSKKVELGEDGGLKSAIRIAIYDEYEAFETYNEIVKKFGAVEPFVNLMKSEAKHYEGLIKLAREHDITPPVNDVKGTISAPDSLEDSFDLAIAKEIENVKLYDYLSTFVEDYPEVLDHFYRYQAKSYNEHLSALRKSRREDEAKEQIPNEELVEKISKMSEMASKISKGELDPSELTGLLSNVNLGLIAGVIAGGLGVAALKEFNKEKDEE